MESRRWLLSVVALASMVATLAAQTPGTTFEVTSIKENRSGSGARPLIRAHSAGLTLKNATVLDLIKWVFHVVERDVVGDLPKWVRTTTFDVTARAARKDSLTGRDVISMTKAL